MVVPNSRGTRKAAEQLVDFGAKSFGGFRTVFGNIEQDIAQVGLSFRGNQRSGTSQMRGLLLGAPPFFKHFTQLSENLLAV